MNDGTGTVEIPFDEDGIRFQSSWNFANKPHDLECFQNDIGFQFPVDFINLIGNRCQATFEHYYKFKQGTFGEIHWTRLLLIMNPLQWHYDVEQDSNKYFTKLAKNVQKRAKRPRTAIVTELLKHNRSLFYSKEHRLFKVPFGDATLVELKTGLRTYGFLAFNINKNNSVVFTCDNRPDILIADTFSKMMEGSCLVHPG